MSEQANNPKQASSSEQKELDQEITNIRGLALDTMMLATYIETGRDRAEREAWLRSVRENMAAVLSAIETVATCSGNLIHREGRSA